VLEIVKWKWPDSWNQEEAFFQYQLLLVNDLGHMNEEVYHELYDYPIIALEVELSLSFMQR